MVWVTLGLGSNIHARDNLSSALDMLLLQFGDLALSSVFESASIGYEGANYLNMAVGLDTDMPLPDLSALLKQIERKHGRDAGQARFAETPLDIDVLTYGQRHGKVAGIMLPRPEVLENAFVLWPLSQVAPRQRHPASGQSYAALWKAYDKRRQSLWPVDFEWHGRRVSSASSA